MEEEAPHNDAADTGIQRGLAVTPHHTTTGSSVAHESAII
jgi:hypothetical protein